MKRLDLVLSLVLLLTALALPAVAVFALALPAIPFLQPEGLAVCSRGWSESSSDTPG